VADQISDFHGKFADTGHVIHLTLSISPGTESGDAAYRVNALDLDGNEQALGCDGFGRHKANYRTYGLVFNQDYTHLLLSIIGDPDGLHPFMTVAYDYSPASPDLLELRFSGYFVVSTISIPTAEGMELRPVTPSISLPLD
jgi:hypothetical protein